MIDRQAEAVLRCTGTADVAAAITLARSEVLDLSIPRRDDNESPRWMASS
jgi:hypothetical protein